MAGPVKVKDYRNNRHPGLEVFKSSASRLDDDDYCVGFAVEEGSGRVAVVDTKDEDCVPLFFGAAEIRAFVAGAKNGDFDHI